MPLAAPLLIPFATAVGLPIAGLGAIEIGKKIQDFVDNNPEKSNQVLNSLKEASLMSLPGGLGLSTLFKKKPKEEVEEVEETEEISTGSGVEEKIKEILVEEGVDIEGIDLGDLPKNLQAKVMKGIAKSSSNKKQDMKEASVIIGLSGPINETKKIDDEVEDRYEGGLEEIGKAKGYDWRDYIPSKSKFKKYNVGGRVGFANGGDNIIGADLKDERPFYQQVIEDKIIDVIPDDIVTAHGNAMYTPQGIANTSNSIRDYHIAANADLSNRISNKIGENYGNIAQTAYNIAAPALSIPASFGYDYSQARSRMEPGSGIKGLAKAFMDEAPFSAAYQRAIGAAAPLAEQSSNVLNRISDFFFAPAGAADFQGGEMLQGSKPIRTNVQGRDLEADLGTRINPNIQPQQNMFQRAGNVAQKGIGFLKDSPGMLLSAASGIPFAGPVLSGLGSIFNQPYIGAGSATMDEYGNIYSAEQLDKMNALGGYYSDPARASRRRDTSIRNMLARQAAGKKIGENRLAALQAQQEKEKAAARAAFLAEAQRKSKASQLGGSDRQSGGKYAGGDAFASANPYGGSGTMNDLGADSFYKDGGVITLFVETK